MPNKTRAQILAEMEASIKDWRKDHAPSEETIERQKARSESPLKKKKKKPSTAALGDIFSRPRITAPSHISKKDLADLKEDFK